MVSRAQTRANYDRLSRWYDLLANSSERKYRELGLRQLDVRPGERVLEIGPGPGHALLPLARAAGPTGIACGLDLSSGMCRIARKRTTQAGSSSPSAIVLCGDAAGLPFLDRAFNAIFMSFTLELFDAADMAGVLEECRRVLREDGRLGVVALSEFGQPNLMRRAYGWAHRRFPAWIDCRPIAVTDILAGHGLIVRSATRDCMWGLPVEIAVASKGTPAA